MSLFESAAVDYARHRPGIPDEVVRLLAGVLEGIDRPVLLDLGAGTGQVPAALVAAMPGIVRVDLVDADEGMLREAAARLPSLPSAGTIAFHTMSAEEFTTPHAGSRAHLITCACLPLDVQARSSGESFARPALFRGRHARFEQEAHSLLEEHARGEGLVKDAVFTVLLARRPGGDL
ncbi:methyltransferase domain-containing protein [Streptomyces olivochromogenes]|uniref:Methyltransferase domain-containing protein n=1 Tax=Streptomyces olivochromogenes TaxID=1963 RepID=A0A250VUC1_STROL|nr:class I SAM-dependent methyltransferase [Streptomyces olivochromogenes]KUN35938.1 hypothetical protein AQJ27_47785 [Streptomyces olivochromogenes]GAX57848.1 hypothetical protein SO3561_09418 [Streptomyces olivochromogenes]